MLTTSARLYTSTRFFVPFSLLPCSFSFHFFPLLTGTTTDLTLMRGALELCQELHLEKAARTIACAIANKRKKKECLSFWFSSTLSTALLIISSHRDLSPCPPLSSPLSMDRSNGAPSSVTPLPPTGPWIYPHKIEEQMPSEVEEHLVAACQLLLPKRNWDGTPHHCHNFIIPEPPPEHLFFHCAFPQACWTWCKR